MGVMNISDHVSENQEEDVHILGNKRSSVKRKCFRKRNGLSFSQNRPCLLAQNITTKNFLDSMLSLKVDVKLFPGKLPKSENAVVGTHCPDYPINIIQVFFIPFVFLSFLPVRIYP